MNHFDSVQCTFYTSSAQLNQRSGQSSPYTFTTATTRFAIHSRPTFWSLSVSNFFTDDLDQFLFVSLINSSPQGYGRYSLFLTHNFNENFIFFTKRHCLLLFTQQWHDITSVEQAPLKRCFTGIEKYNDSSKFDFLIYGYTFTPNFGHCFQINWKILHISLH